MCGIFGYIGPEDATEVCLEGLKSLAYRGYDSSGIVGLTKGLFEIRKEPGIVAILEDKIRKQPMNLDLAIAQTRWATHGKSTQENAHPHLDEKEEVAIVHNGIIENYQEIRKSLKRKGVCFKSETDSEVIAHLIADLYEGDLIEVARKAAKKMKGQWAIALIHREHPDTILAMAKEAPLCIGHDAEKKEVFISSDPHAFGKSAHSTLSKVLFLKDNQIALIKREKVTLFNLEHEIPPDFHPFQMGERETLSKEGYDHFMLKEIHEQTHTIQQAYADRVVEEFGTAAFESLPFETQELLCIRRIIILGCGTSWHAGCIAASLLEDKARIPSIAEVSSEFRYRNPIIDEDTLVIAISQSGETIDTLSAVREVKAKGAKVLGFCNVPHSTLTREAHGCILLKAGPEISVCSTKAFTSQLTALALFSLLMARLRHMDKDEGKNFLSQIKNLPSYIESVLDQEERIEALAAKYAHFENYFFLGRHYMYFAALESALKLKEISYLNATAYPAGEMKHGPIALVDKNLLTVAFAGNQRTLPKLVSNLMEVKARSGPILLFAPAGTVEISSLAYDLAHDIVWLPRHVCDELAPIPYAVAGQLFAYYIALKRGTNIDQPRNLAKSVTVE